MYSPSQRQSRPIRPLFRVIRNCKTLQGVGRIVRYVAFASKDLVDKQKGAFDGQHDQADVRSFIEQARDPLTRHPSAPKIFHCFFSLRRDQFEQCGLKDWKEPIREVMRTYERETGRRLEWIAAQHDNETHPHCHVIIKAVYEKSNGKRHKLHLSRNDLNRFREIGTRVLEVERSNVQALERAAGPVIDLPQVAARTAGLLVHYLRDLMRQERKRAKEIDRLHQKWLWQERWEEDERER